MCLQQEELPVALKSLVSAVKDRLITGDLPFTGMYTTHFVEYLGDPEREIWSIAFFPYKVVCKSLAGDSWDCSTCFGLDINGLLEVFDQLPIPPAVKWFANDRSDWGCDFINVMGVYNGFKCYLVVSSNSVNDSPVGCEVEADGTMNKLI